MIAFLLAGLALLAFAANSVLARLAFTTTAVDAWSFTAIRLVTGAVTLGVIIAVRHRAIRTAGGWPAALALLVYALAFAVAYQGLTAATGALLLFGAVQTTMLLRALQRGERLVPVQWLGFACAVGGMVWLLLPGLAAPPVPAALTMIAAGVAWGLYTLLARSAGDPIRATAGNFIRASMLVLLVAPLFIQRLTWDGQGAWLAAVSGSITSAMGYVVWYVALQHIRTSTAAVAQLSVPVITACAGVVLLGESLSLRLLVAGTAILTGIAMVTAVRR